MSFKKVESRVNFPSLEEDVLRYWKDNNIFEKSVEVRRKDKTFSFYDGPPFATGTPHYGNLLAGIIKDVIPRYKTMQGYRVERVWGWDTHGLPIENIVEQELRFKTRIQVEEYGIDNFNEKCKTKVLKYADDWQQIVEKTGRWVDMKNAYLTMDFNYMESVWWVFKSLYEKDLIYKGHKVMPYCPRCSTGLSAFEVGQPGAYQDKNDKAITVKFELEKEPGTYILAWTTTPWTLPGNLALTVGKDIDYVKIQAGNQKYILAKDRVSFYKNELGKLEIIEILKGKDLVGLRYYPVFKYYDVVKKAFEVITGDFVTTEDGTGIVHTAPAFGEEDYKACKENGIDFYMPVNDLGQFEIEGSDYDGKSVVVFETNQQIIEDLQKEGKILKVEDITHSYPHCWRCDTPLIYKAMDSWFVAETKLKHQLLENNNNIEWMPKTVGTGRFAKLLETAPDWNISRNRFWGTPLPVWYCDKCGQYHVFGSRKELEDVAENKDQKIDFTDLHLHNVQKIEVPCHCGGVAKNIGQVLDCWFESGAMPYGQLHYPFENKEKFEESFPADFIAEGIDQTRGWFHSLLVLSTALMGKPSYNQVVVNGIVLAEDGQKMSKHVGNYTDPMVLMNKLGADPIRFYLMASSAVKAGDLNFSEKGVEEVIKSLILRLWNSYSFFVTYASLDNFKPSNNLQPENILDKWMLSSVNGLVEDVTKSLEKYDISKAARSLNEFIDELSNWYIRRSRKRFWKSENDADKIQAYETLYFVLTTYVKLLAPFMPFVTEEIYRNLTGEESVHLADWPLANRKMIDKNIEQSMAEIREIVERGLSERADAGIKVRQPLAKLIVKSKMDHLSDDLVNIIKEEVNVKAVEYIKAGSLSVKLDTNITSELKAEGLARDFVRFIQDGRKKAGFNVDDRISLAWRTDNKEIMKALENQKDYIAKETLALEINTKTRDHEYDQTTKLDNDEVWFGISRKKN